MTDLLDDPVTFRVQPEIDVIFVGDVDGKVMYRETNRWVSRKTYHPNLPRQVMSESQDYEGIDPYRTLPFLRRAGDHADVRIETVAAQMFALVVTDAEDVNLALFTKEVQRFVPQDVLDQLLSKMRMTIKVSRQVRSFVDDAQRLVSQGKIDAALDLIYERADEMLLAGEFDVLDAIIESLDVEQLSIDVLLGVLTITLPAKDKLLTRKKFFEAVQQTLQDRGEYREGLLTGLQ